MNEQTFQDVRIKKGWERNEGMWERGRGLGKGKEV